MGIEIHKKGVVYNSDTITDKQLAAVRKTDADVWQQIVDYKAENPDVAEESII